VKRTRFRPLILGAAWSIFLLALMLFGAPPKIVGVLSLPLLPMIGLAVDPTSRRPVWPIVRVSIGTHPV
jgi:hypothetical protein